MQRSERPKKKKQQPLTAIQSLDGPPIDFSFKKIRHLSQLHSSTKAQPIPSTKQQLKQQIPAENQPIMESKLTIIRTINVDNQQTKSTSQSNTHLLSKQHQKQVRKVESKTTALFLRYNKITLIEGITMAVERVFPNINHLMWLDLSHNRISTLSEELGLLPSLKTLYLHVNYISNFKQIDKLASAKLLRVFTIHANPLQSYAQFRVLIASIIPSLNKIDSTLLTKRERERGGILLQQIKKYPLVVNPSKPPQESQNQDQS